MITPEHWLALARQLEKYRLYRGALRAIDRVSQIDDPIQYDLRERIKARASDPAPLPGLYYLVTVDGQGFALPLTAIIKIDNPVYFLGEEARGALLQAYAAVAGHLAESDSHHPLQPMTCKFHIDVGEFFEIDGPSLGLAAALAYAAHTCDRRWTAPVLVTGEITDNGCVHNVGGLEIKLRAALDELGPGGGHVLIPHGNAPACEDPRVRKVASLAEAFDAVWGTAQLRLAAHLLDFSTALKEIRGSFDNQQNIERLQTLYRPDLSPADLALLHHELMIQHRHAGHTEEAERYARLGRELVDQAPHLIDASTIQEMSIQRLGNDLNRFPGDWFRVELERVLELRLDLPNRVRCLGMLARFESVNGEHEAAIHYRLAAWENQKQRADQRRRIPTTLCHLVWETARGGHLDEFVKYAGELQSVTPDNDARQWSYNHHAVVAGALRFGGHEAVCAFLEGGPPPYPAFEPQLRDFFHSDAAVIGHPQISTLRQLIRACRKAGRLDDARRLGRRFNASAPGTEEDLTRWLFQVCALERDLAWCDHDGSGVDSIRKTADALVACHQAASCYYADMVDACTNFDGTATAIAALEREMEGLYY